MLCPCNSNKPFSDCCELFVTRKELAKTAEQLMRSRYTAYVLGNIDYILRTHHVSSRPTADRKSILAWTKSVTWMGLEVLSTQNGLDNTTGYVEFKALYQENGKLECIHEKSYFVKENGLWFYKSGIHK